MFTDRVFCREVCDPSDPMLAAVERLYHRTQNPNERIPWAWIARSLQAKADWQPGQPARHLILAHPERLNGEAGPLAGFLLSTFLPGFGGYVSYMGVAPKFRGRGIGTRLFEQAFKLLAADAGAIDELLPFVIWESRRPEPDAPPNCHSLWQARVKLFDRVGGLWAKGLELQTPNYSEGKPSGVVPLQLFAAPIDMSARQLALRNPLRIADGLLQRVYRMTPDQPLYLETMNCVTKPRFRRAKLAGRLPAERQQLLA